MQSCLSLKRWTTSFWRSSPWKRDLHRVIFSMELWLFVKFASPLKNFTAKPSLHGSSRPKNIELKPGKASKRSFRITYRTNHLKFGIQTLDFKKATTEALKFRASAELIQISSNDYESISESSGFSLTFRHFKESRLLSILRYVSKLEFRIKKNSWRNSQKLFCQRRIQRKFSWNPTSFWIPKKFLLNFKNYVCVWKRINS